MHGANSPAAAHAGSVRTVVLTAGGVTVAVGAGGLWGHLQTMDSAVGRFAQLPPGLPSGYTLCTRVLSCERFQ